ncbi:MAG: aminotransferase class I/II-fold pyridoxal phosphate-dependent enzyme [Acidimicrobiales bacterium]
MTAALPAARPAAFPAARPAAVPSGVHGGDGARVAAALGVDASEVLDLSASTNPLAPDVVALAARYLDGLRRYPDPSDATRALGAAMGVETDRLLLTNGGSEAISLVAGELGGHVEEPEFSLHPRGGGPRWRSNPHNPTGRLAAAHERAGVWDEAFYPLATGRWTRGDPDAVVVGSLTKLCSCPGLRLGYVLAAPELIARLASRQVCWSVNALAAALLPELLAGVDLPSWAAGIAELRTKLVGVLDAHGLEPLASDANYVLCARADGLRERLVPYGVVVRDCTTFGLSGHARVAVPGELGLARLADALGASAP